MNHINAIQIVILYTLMPWFFNMALESKYFEFWLVVLIPIWFISFCYMINAVLERLEK